MLKKIINKINKKYITGHLNNKIIFNSNVRFDARLKIRDKLQYEYHDIFIISLDSENNLIFKENKCLNPLNYRPEPNLNN